MSLYAIPGGRDMQPHAANTVRPTSTRRKFARDFDAACANLPSHVTNLRPTNPPPPAVPTVLLAVTLLEASLIRSVLAATGSLPGAELAARIAAQCHPSSIVEVDPGWADSDPTPAHGTQRPVS